MKKITGDEDFTTPLILLFMFSMMLSLELKDLLPNIQGGTSSLISKPAIFTGDIFETISRLSWFILPLVIGLSAIREQNTLLKGSYFIGIWPLILTQPVIEKTGYRSLYILKAALIFLTVFCLIVYLNKVALLYKKAIKKDL